MALENLSIWGALLLNPKGEVIHSWNLLGGPLTEKARLDRLVTLSGAQVSAEGSIIYVMQECAGGFSK